MPLLGSDIPQLIGLVTAQDNGTFARGVSHYRLEAEGLPVDEGALLKLSHARTSPDVGCMLWLSVPKLVTDPGFRLAVMSCKAPFTDSATNPGSPVHCPLASWTALRVLSWTAKENGSSGAAVIAFMGHSHYPDQVLGS